jgi:hypothetical protein
MSSCVWQQRELSLISCAHRDRVPSCYAGNTHRDVRLAAGIVLKNNLRYYWEGLGSLTALSQEEREVFKTHVLPTLYVEVDNSIKKILAEIVRILNYTEFPQNWPE